MFWVDLFLKKTINKIYQHVMRNPTMHCLQKRVIKLAQMRKTDSTDNDHDTMHHLEISCSFRSGRARSTLGIAN